MYVCMYVLYSYIMYTCGYMWIVCSYKVSIPEMSKALVSECDIGFKWYCV